MPFPAERASPPLPASARSWLPSPHPGRPEGNVFFAVFSFHPAPCLRLPQLPGAPSSAFLPRFRSFPTSSHRLCRAFSFSASAPVVSRASFEGRPRPSDGASPPASPLAPLPFPLLPAPSALFRLLRALFSTPALLPLAQYDALCMSLPFRHSPRHGKHPNSLHRNGSQILQLRPPEGRKTQPSKKYLKNHRCLVFAKDAFSSVAYTGNRAEYFFTTVTGRRLYAACHRQKQMCRLWYLRLHLPHACLCLSNEKKSHSGSPLRRGVLALHSLRAGMQTEGHKSASAHAHGAAVHRRRRSARQIRRRT